MFNVFRQEGQLALARAREASAVCRKHGFAYYLAWAEILEGWAIAVEGDPPAGLTRLRHGLDALKATGAELRLPFYYGLLAEVCGMAGQIGEALANVASGFAFQSKNGEMWSAPELHRIHGDVLLRSGDASQSRGELPARHRIGPADWRASLEIRAAARMREPLKLRSSAQRKPAER